MDHSLVLVDGVVDAAGLYVPMTRARTGNDVWVVVDPISEPDAVDVLADSLHRRWLDEPALAQLPLPADSARPESSLDGCAIDL